MQKSVDISKLIELVRSHECLYNKNDSNYRNKDAVSMVWNNISLELGASERLCREKWSMIRSNYCRELRKMRERKLKYPNQPYVITWPHFKAVSFLKNTFQSFGPMKGDNSIYLSGEPTGPYIKEEVAVSESNYYDDQEESFPYEEPEISQPELLSYNALPMYDRKVSANGEVESTHSMSEISKLRETLEKSQINYDSDTHFLLSLHDSMAQLTPANKMAFRIEVQKMLQKFLFSAD